MTSVCLVYGMIGVATIAACTYMVCHGCAWWQVLCVAALGVSILPGYTRKESDHD